MNHGPCGALLQVGSGQPADSGAVSGAQYRAPAGSNLCWENPHSDPYSVLNVFSRQQRYGTRGEWLGGGGGGVGDVSGTVCVHFFFFLGLCTLLLLLPRSLPQSGTFKIKHPFQIL